MRQMHTDEDAKSCRFESETKTNFRRAGNAPLNATERPMRALHTLSNALQGRKSAHPSSDISSVSTTSSGPISVTTAYPVSNLASAKK